jgi:diguanylate cyclase (GGDEF)-like protein/putative nucleotidyltransferase with HDIG domain
MTDGQSCPATPLVLQTGENRIRTFMVNGAPIMDGGKMRGALATFDDVTQLEEQNDKLQEMLKELEQSRDEIRTQNRKLRILATQDPLTSCLNRRSFFQKFEVEFNRAQRYGHGLCCVMIDIDHFKTINDRYGHLTGDRVLQGLADVLRSALRESDFICRYGGEEFCILLSHTEAENAVKTAERFRVAIESKSLAGIKVTISLGVSSLEFGAGNSQELVGQADTALYAAKNNGRNRVLCWDEKEVALLSEQREGTVDGEAPEAEGSVYIPHHVVNALMLALAHRDVGTAEHSRQVGDFCAAAAQGLMSANDSYLVEVAGLLHDIGKLGVPDSILLKPGPLSEEEWKLMRDHERRSVEVIASTFLSPELVEIVRCHHAFYGKASHNTELPKGEDIPLGARILSIADSFSAMISDRPYRKALSYEEAFAELRRCAGQQFDPDLVEHFIEIVKARDETRQEGEKSVSNAVKLEIGREVEKLFVAVNTSPFGTLAGVADRLAVKAAKHGLMQIAEKATQIEKATEEQGDLVHIMELTSELMKACGTKESFLHD